MSLGLVLLEKLFTRTPQSDDIMSDKNSTPSKDKKKSTFSKPSTSFKEDLETLDSKWPERLSCMDALILAKSLQPVNRPQTIQPISQPTFQHVVVSPVKQPPAGVVTSDHLNLTIVQGYASRSSEASGLSKDQFVKIRPS